jgi:DegV family protein with EDD domain
MAKVNIKIVSDSTCDLPYDLIDKYNIGIVPVNIIFDDNKVLKQGIHINNEEFFQRLATIKNIPTTAIPAPRYFKDAYEEALQEADQVITFCVTSKLSGMYSNASLVADRYFKDTVTVIDTQLATLQMGYVVLEAAKMAAKGESKEAIIEHATKYLMPNVRIIGLVPTLKYLEKGGRIGKAASLIGGILNYKPFIGVEEGVVAAFGRARGYKKGYKALLNLVKNIAGKQLEEQMIVAHTARPELAKKLAKEISEIKNAPKDLQLMEIGPAIGVHLGPGVLGFVWVGPFEREWLGL